jgi:hypothetical protein
VTCVAAVMMVMCWERRLPTARLAECVSVVYECFSFVECLIRASVQVCGKP